RPPRRTKQREWRQRVKTSNHGVKGCASATKFGIRIRFCNRPASLLSDRREFWRLCGWHADWSIRARMETASTRVHDPRQATFKDGLGTRYRREGTEGPFEVLVLRDTFARSEEHTSELQSLRHLVCRLLLEKKK